MIRFRKAVEVQPGERITSAHHNALARAVNERILSGLGDPTFRIVQYLAGLFRSCVMGEGYATHADAEFFEVFQHIEPGVASWPETGVGDPQGPNTYNPAMAWVYGNEQVGLLNESRRLDAVLFCFAGDTAETKWNTAKAQRGGIDPVTGYAVAPAMDLGQEFAKLAYRKDGLFATSYGGFLPGPDQLDTPCAAPCIDCNIYPRDNLDIYFTAARPDVTGDGMHFASTELIHWDADPAQYVLRGHYAGTCIQCLDFTEPPPEDGNRCPDYSSHINLYYELPSGWLVMLNNGAEDRLPHNDWIEGPYTTQKQVGRDYGDQVRRMVNAFNREFRGTNAQRPGGKLRPGAAFNVQDFMTRQYALAPARGTQAGAEIEVSYPAWKLESGTYSAGQALAGNGRDHWAEGFVATHAFAIVRTAGSKSVALKVSHDDGSFTFSADESGTIVALPLAARLLNVRVELVGDVTLEPGESIEVELNEVQSYLPQWFDLYTVLRKGGAKLAGLGQQLDGSGTEESNARDIWNEYAETGALVNVHDQSSIGDPTEQGSNAVYDAARRLSKSVRMLNRFALLDYEVNGAGDSVLYFTPHPRTAGHPMVAATDDGDPDIDTFSGVEVKPASQRGFSSRWVFDCFLKPYTSAEGSPMSFDLYADWFADVERCLVGDLRNYTDRSFARHVNRNVTTHTGTGSQFPLAPTGWRFAQLFNSWFDVPQFLNHEPDSYSDSDRTKFAKSCRLYEPPVEVRSVERTTQRGRDVVIVTLKGRLHNTCGESSGAPDSIPRHGWMDDPAATAWNWSTIAAEPFRTTENAIRLYLFYRWQGTEAPTSLIMGDYSLGAAEFHTGQHAACIPEFLFTQLIPEAWIDNNTAQNSTDSPFNHDAELQAEWYLRCMSEGYVAGEGALDCSDPSAARTYDWKWSNLCEHVFGLPSASAFPLMETARLKGADVRADGPEGFGPLPMTKASSEVFNRLVRIVNALSRVRVMLPWKIERRDGLAGATSWVPGHVDYGCGEVTYCGYSSWCVTDATPPPADSITWGAWYDTDGLGVVVQTGAGLPISISGGCDGSGSWALNTIRSATEFRFSIVDWTIYQHAIPSAWRDMVEPSAEHAGAVFSWQTETVYNEAKAGGMACPAPTTCELVEHYSSETVCRFLKNGSAMVDAGSRAPGGWFATAFSPSVNLCNYGSGTIISVNMLTDTVPLLDIPVIEEPEGLA